MKPVLIAIAVLAALWCLAPLLPFIAAMAMFLIWVVLFGSLLLD